ncbi:unnamed protein product [Linum trigynum]|uniref:Uncharacterized protein n=1 Tax=Linum trigynum TaxID=586398 RepID=A0AAV2EKM8_9ROSI
MPGLAVRALGQECTAKSDRCTAVRLGSARPCRPARAEARHARPCAPARAAGGASADGDDGTAGAADDDAFMNDIDLDDLGDE